MGTNEDICGHLGTGPGARPRYRLAVNYGTVYPALLKLEQEGYISTEWGVSDKLNVRLPRSDARRPNSLQ